MKNKTQLLWVTVFIFTSINIKAGAKNHLQSCYQKQIKPLYNKVLNFDYAFSKNNFYHSFEPWQTYSSKSKGNIFLTDNVFLKLDSTKHENKIGVNKTQLLKEKLLVLNFGDTAIKDVSNTDYFDAIIESAGYTPNQLLIYFYHNKINTTAESNNEYSIYKVSINEIRVTLYIKNNVDLVEKITTLEAHQLYGDVLHTYYYKDYSNIGKVYFPQHVSIEKINNKLQDEVAITHVNILPKLIEDVSMPINFKWKPEPIVSNEFTTEKFNNHLHFIQIKNSKSKILLVEFKDFLVLVGAPLNSENGELIITEAKKMVPNKPIKYFAFGHFHSHYTGGIRAFIHKGTTVLCTEQDVNYIQFLANAKHTIKPDSLELQPMLINIQTLNDSATISDGEYEMKLYHIGKKSEHTNDYIVFYFPSEKILFEEDLVWIKNKGEIQKANLRQAGLYHAIGNLHLQVDTIIQSWPVLDYNVKSIIPFAELEKSMNVKQ